MQVAPRTIYFFHVHTFVRIDSIINVKLNFVLSNLTCIFEGVY